MKGFAALQGFAGLIAAVTAVSRHQTWKMEQLAREKGGSLTVLKANTDGRMTVEKAEEILRVMIAIDGKMSRSNPEE